MEHIVRLTGQYYITDRSSCNQPRLYGQQKLRCFIELYEILHMFLSFFRQCGIQVPKLLLLTIMDERGECQSVRRCLHEIS